jgi:hypothetical protein
VLQCNVVAASTAKMKNFKQQQQYAHIPSKLHEYTLRTLFGRYRDAGGACWVEATPPEYSVVEEAGEITCMNRMKFHLGMPASGFYFGPEPRVHETMSL